MVLKNESANRFPEVFHVVLTELVEVGKKSLVAIVG